MSDEIAAEKTLDCPGCQSLKGCWFDGSDPQRRLSEML